VKPLSFRTNCSEDARISSSVAGGLKLCRVLIFRHIVFVHHLTLSPNDCSSIAVFVIQSRQHGTCLPGANRELRISRALRIINCSASACVPNMIKETQANSGSVKCRYHIASSADLTPRPTAFLNKSTVSSSGVKSANSTARAFMIPDGGSLDGTPKGPTTRVPSSPQKKATTTLRRLLLLRPHNPESHARRTPIHRRLLL
jgi:hypothetical protein